MRCPHPEQDRLVTDAVVAQVDLVVVVQVVDDKVGQEVRRKVGGRFDGDVSASASVYFAAR